MIHNIAENKQIKVQSSIKVRALTLYDEFLEQKWKRKRSWSELNVESDPFTPQTALNLA